MYQTDHTIAFAIYVFSSPAAMAQTPKVKAKAKVATPNRSLKRQKRQKRARNERHLRLIRLSHRQIPIRLQSVRLQSPLYQMHLCQPSLVQKTPSQMIMML